MEEEKKDVVEEETKEESKEEKKEDSKLVKAFTDTKDDTSEFDKKDVEENVAMGVLSYIWILWLVPLLAAPSSKFAKYHANQGLILFIFEMVGGFVLGILTIIPYIGFVFWILLSIFELLCLILAILGIVNAVQGKAKELPLIGKWKLIDYTKVTPKEEAKEDAKEEPKEEEKTEEEPKAEEPKEE